MHESQDNTATSSKAKKKKNLFNSFMPEKLECISL